LPANFLDIPPLSSSTPVQQKKKPATEIQIKLSLSQVERENEVREHEQQNQNRIIENTDQTISQQADVAQNHELQNPIFAAPAPPPERLNISVDQETQTASEEPPQPAMTNHAFNNRFFRPPQPQNGEPPNQISMPNQIFYRNMLRENLRKLLWGNLPSLYEGIPEQYQEHLKTVNYLKNRF
uniref:Uncharacterized protein n=1 Tax=Acrobeloides nanus TaxID=290746 RepID=A0A914DMN6_9BILA